MATILKVLFDVRSQIRLRKMMRIYLKNIPAAAEVLFILIGFEATEP